MGENFEATKEGYWVFFDLAEFNDDIENFAKDEYESIKNNITLVAAFVTVLNHKCWYWYDKGNNELSSKYSDLYYKYNEKAWDWLEEQGTDEEKSWYFKTMD